MCQGLYGGVVSQSESVRRFTRTNPPIHFKAVEIGVSSITFSWEANANPGATAYRLDYWAVGTATASVTANALQITLSNLSAGTTFFAAIRSLNGDGLASSIGSPADSPDPRVVQVVTAGA